MIRAIASALLVGSASVAAYSPDALADQITNLPGAETLDIKFNQFSGYLTVNSTKQLHYWLVESEKDPANDPIAFWTNGGPGCSGLLGFFTEQGPFRPNKDMSLSLNDYAWNKISNMVFIEAPCGVGFSYSDNEDDYITGDAQTAKDNYELIQAFFDRFPEYRDNDMYISSESYGGHYMPTLAQQIVDENSSGTSPKLNFKGFAVGNPYTTQWSGTPASLETMWGHQLIAQPTWNQYQADCVHSKKPNLQECEMLVVEMYIQMGDLNPYALDYPVCVEDEIARKGRMQRNWFMMHQLGENASSQLRQAIGLPLKGAENYEPCEEDWTTTYLNLPEVKSAMHVKTDVKWMECSYTLKYATEDGRNSMVPIYQYLINGGYGLNILVYSGDDDSVCGTVGTQSWIWDMGYEIDGRKWTTYTVNQQTAGYITKWTNTKLAFVTVHHSGHEVPAYTPEIALDLWDKYLKGEWTNA